ncbi:MAG TPA: hypothetical protein VGD07_01930 [Methylomirabilota bacterium]
MHRAGARGRRLDGREPGAHVVPPGLALPQRRDQRRDGVAAAHHRLGQPRDLTLEPLQLAPEGVPLLVPGVVGRLPERQRLLDREVDDPGDEQRVLDGRQHRPIGLASDASSRLPHTRPPR